VEIGPRDMAADAVFVGCRNRPHRDKIAMDRQAFISELSEMLDDIQQSLFDRALAFQQARTERIDSTEAFDAYFTPASQEKPDIHGGFALAHWCGSDACETRIKEALQVTIRCIPDDPVLRGEATGRCIYCDQPSDGRVVFAKAY